VPGLSQYWHPHLLAARVTGRVVAGEAAFPLDGARAYAEKNWGRGFPREWWWGQAHDFDGGAASVAFAGGRVGVGRLAGSATALVVGLDGRLLALGPSRGAPVLAAVDGDAWRLRARSPRHRVALEGEAGAAAAHVLQVPLPAERRTAPRSHHHLAGTLRLRVWRGRRLAFAGESGLAGLERDVR
jgi:hypothetical protein